MLPIVTVEDLRHLIAKTTLKRFFIELIECLKQDFAAWDSFIKSPRMATHLEYGVLELMPICGPEYFAFKYVNGHPNNTLENKQTVVALGLLADVSTGYPILVSEMTLLTALRTAATCALAALYLAKPNSQNLAIIGTGAQSEFQVLAFHYLLNINKIKYYDRDPEAMKKFARNLAAYPLELIPGQNIRDAIHEADIITTATATKQKVMVLENEWIASGVHINGIGGDCPGKTELDLKILERSKIVVEYLAQTQQEGEIQGLQNVPVYAELWELIKKDKPGRVLADEVTVFDSVGFALEDYSILRYVHQLVHRFPIAHSLSLVPELKDPKDLFSILRTCTK